MVGFVAAKGGRWTGGLEVRIYRDPNYVQSKTDKATNAWASLCDVRELPTAGRGTRDQS
jgi:hypothetical protein